MQLNQVHRRGTRANQPVANTLAEGVLYYVTDENKTEVVFGGAWTSYNDSSGAGTSHSLLTNLSADDHTQYLLASEATDRGTFTTNWTDLTDGGATALHTHTGTTSEATEIAFEDPATQGATSDWERTLEQPLLYRQVILSCRESTMSGDLTLLDGDAQYQFLDPNAADRVVTLPANFTGETFLFFHKGSANTLTIKDASANTVTTLTTGQCKTVIYSGTAWHAFGG